MPFRCCLFFCTVCRALVYTRGSHFLSCFFSWNFSCYVSMQFRKWTPDQGPLLLSDHFGLTFNRMSLKEGSHYTVGITKTKTIFVKKWTLGLRTGISFSGINVVQLWLPGLAGIQPSQPVPLFPLPQPISVQVLHWLQLGSASQKPPRPQSIS